MWIVCLADGSHEMSSLIFYKKKDNNIKEILVYVYFGSIVNCQPKN